MERVVYEVVPNPVADGYRVQPSRMTEENNYFAVFIGPVAEERAREYAEFMNRVRVVNPFGGIGAINSGDIVDITAELIGVSDVELRRFLGGGWDGKPAILPEKYRTPEPPAEPSPDPSWRDKPPLL